MLNKKLEEQKLRIEKEIKQIELVLNDIENKNNEIKKTNKEKIDIEIEKSNYKFEKKKLSELPKNVVAKFIKKNFSSEYKENQEKIKELEEKIEKLTKEKTELSEKSDKLQSEIEKVDVKKGEIRLEELKEEQEDIKNKKQAIKQLILTNPELLKEKTFILDLLNENINYISLDKTNDDEVYTKALELLKEDKRITSDKDKKIIKDCIKEIVHPKKEKKGKYKIPHKYLYEQIRMSFSSNEEENNIYNIFAYKNYLDADCKLSKEFGEQIEKLYESDENYLLIHSIDNSFIMMPDEECEKIKDKIFEEGLKSVNTKPNMLKYTTIGNYQKRGHFLEFLRPGKKILLSIPKEYIDNEGPIWGADEEVVTEEGGYILPEYIIGYINQEELIENKLLNFERKDYKYTFSDGQLEARNKTKNA